MPVTIKPAHLKYKDPETGNYVPVSAIGSPLNPVLDVQVGGTTITQDGVANVPKASQTSLGVVRLNALGVQVNSDAVLMTKRATSANIKSGTESYNPIVPVNQHESVFYGLAKLAGQDMASSSNAIGTYTSQAKTAIKTMLGVTDPAVSDVQINGTSILQNGVANVPVASSSAHGVVRTSPNDGIAINTTTGELFVSSAQTVQIKLGTNQYRPIAPNNQHQAVFYGLAKLAGADMASSSNAVGVYTPEAKAAIQTMLGVEQGVVFVEEITGRTPSITGEPNTRYICGEVDEITITPPQVGTIDVRFTSGSSTVVIMPNTVKFPSWIDLTSIETNTVYEIIITDGVYGGVMTWPV